MNKINWSTIDNFTPNEFKCPCCGLLNVSTPFIIKLEEARNIAEIPFRITSGCRCKKHNEEVGGAEHSRHLCSKHIPATACDIKVNTDRRRFIIVRALQEAGFTHIGIGKDFVHVDNDRKKAIWLY